MIVWKMGEKKIYLIREVKILCYSLNFKSYKYIQENEIPIIYFCDSFDLGFFLFYKNVNFVFGFFFQSFFSWPFNLEFLVISRKFVNR